MNKIMRACPILFALACAACNGTGSKQEGGFGQPPPEDTTVPTGPLHIAFEGIYDAHIPVNEQDTYLNYSCVNEPCGASLYVKVPVQSPVHVGISGAYWPSSGNETVPADRHRAGRLARMPADACARRSTVACQRRGGGALPGCAHAPPLYGICRAMNRCASARFRNAERLPRRIGPSAAPPHKRLAVPEANCHLPEHVRIGRVYSKRRGQ